MKSPFQHLSLPIKLGPLALAALLMLSACGGGGSSTSATGGGTTPDTRVTLTGAFVDSPVAGLSYTTSSGLSGVTDASGHFNFREGDTVTFTLAGVSLGSTAAAESITPAHLASGEDTNRFTNLLILLQSLDTDGNPDNGITLPANLAQSIVAAVVNRLDDDPADFEDSGNNTVLAGIAHGGTVRTKEDAAQHFEKAQGAINAFYEDATGVWRATTDSGTDLILRLTTSGRYVLSTLNGDEPERIGIEVGSLKRNPTTGQFMAVDIKVDTNGSGGLSNPLAAEVFTLQFYRADDNHPQDRLVITRKVGTDEAVEVSFSRTAEGPMYGAWSVSSELKAGAPMLVFDAFSPAETPNLYSGNFNLIDPEGSPNCNDQPIRPGLERGSYSLDVSNDALVLSFTGVSVDTNSCSGVQFGEGQFAGPYTITPIDDYTVLLTQVLPVDSVDTPEVFKLYRVKRRVAQPD